MDEQTSASLGGSHRRRSMFVAMFVCGLFSIVPYLAHSQEQNEGPTALGQAAPFLAPAGVVTSTRNPLQIAILHWYSANQTTAFGVGTNPQGMAFDGANIWV